jgi:hypothetical protein
MTNLSSATILVAMLAVTAASADNIPRPAPYNTPPQRRTLPPPPPPPPPAKPLVKIPNTVIVPGTKDPRGKPVAGATIIHNF